MKKFIPILLLTFISQMSYAGGAPDVAIIRYS